MKKIFLTGILMVSLVLAAVADGIVTARNYFDSVSAVYGALRDYEADIDIKANKTTMKGKVSYKKPNLLRIDFSTPSEQVICFNGELLTIYLPGSSAILNQSVQNTNSGNANMATPQGLSLMSRYYSVAYLKSGTPVPLDDDAESPELVVKLRLSRKNTTEAFRYINMSVDPQSKLIRQLEGITPQGESFVFNFKNYILNSGIPDNRFVYDAPSSANNYNNFLFSE
ncbi:LolA family protein [Treponema saccharophilum]|uniref:Outer membrane lipoprotein carrier protein LolA n=2 Tax=Treponema TaxID=157 RepID=H7EMY5_9SPIR|nr:outer-membrane lipoprotein carrier protein LolA [Treponema saccharophilum]EIC01049.1 outer membrane lipoprotein carrier protein LolA [Treponema saccharophilum DSM 2985]MBQ5536592.1 outer membrane lipoprotein carrier protein LolA [Treponema sp.]BDC95361.1 membrane protein [Treponema saccharophilum]